MFVPISVKAFLALKRDHFLLPRSFSRSPPMRDRERVLFFSNGKKIAAFDQKESNSDEVMLVCVCR